MAGERAQNKQFGHFGCRRYSEQRCLGILSLLRRILCKATVALEFGLRCVQDAQITCLLWYRMTIFPWSPKSGDSRWTGVRIAPLQL